MTFACDTHLVRELTEAAERDGIERHVVAAVITDDAGQVLIVRRAGDDVRGGRWELPSGAVDEGEQLTQALLREVEEETGLRVLDVNEYLGCFDYPSGSGASTRQSTFTVDVTGVLRLDPHEHDAHDWAARDTTRVSAEVQEILRTIG
ncbi:NUDIX domain-containing protein [Kineosporia sp. J2-2]|uniref:NUDIX domain-containing protein n=1 Tax=Kineosporia corallincola TaxID=2835133 RepID=A0ABS5TBZ2_9ACTN|nr:NUDIX domain-containing protein [Kineosporia corallincola]MBT0768597.1 NUDIX domain-containing protein [Kineosporia corallincola]